MDSQDSKVNNFANSLFLLLLLIIIRSDLLAEIRWSMCMSKSHRSLCESYSWTGAGLFIYHLFVWSNLNFMHISQWITLPTQSHLVLYSFSANLLHSLIISLIASSLSPHTRHLLFCWVLSILALIWLFPMALYFAAIRRDYYYYYYYLRVFHICFTWWLLLLLFYTLWVFHTGVWVRTVFHVFMTLLSILADLHSVVVWIFSISLEESNSNFQWISFLTKSFVKVCWIYLCD